MGERTVAGKAVFAMGVIVIVSICLASALAVCQIHELQEDLAESREKASEYSAQLAHIRELRSNADKKSSDAVYGAVGERAAALSDLSPEELASIGRVQCPETDLGTFVMQGITDVGLTRYTYISDKFFSFAGLAAFEPGWNMREDGVFCDVDGFVVCTSGIRDYGDIVKTPLGDGKVYELIPDVFVIDVFVHEQE